MIKHVVLFKFKSEVELSKNKEKLKNIKVLLEKLKGHINCLSFIEVGLNSNPSEAYDLSLITEFETWDDLKAYVVHPEHQKVAAIIRETLDQRACVDYEF